MVCLHLAQRTGCAARGSWTSPGLFWQHACVSCRCCSTPLALLLLCPVALQEGAARCSKERRELLAAASPSTQQQPARGQRRHSSSDIASSVLMPQLSRQQATGLAAVRLPAEASVRACSVGGVGCSGVRTKRLACTPKHRTQPAVDAHCWRRQHCVVGAMGGTSTDGGLPSLLSLGSSAC